MIYNKYSNNIAERIGYYPQLPNGWAIIKVGDAAIYVNGRAFKPEEWNNKGLPIIRIQNLNDAAAHYNYSCDVYEDKYLIHKGDLLFAWAASLGTYIWNGNEAWLNQHIFKVIPYPFMDKKFLYYAFKSMISDFMPTEVQNFCHSSTMSSSCMYLDDRKFASSSYFLTYPSTPPSST